MLRTVQAEIDQKHFRRERRDGPGVDYGGLAFFLDFGKIEVPTDLFDEKTPVQFDENAVGYVPERKIVYDISTGCVCQDIQRACRFVTVGGQHVSRGDDGVFADENVQVAELPERDVAVGALRKCRAFECECLDTIGFKQSDDTQHFGGHEHVAVRELRIGSFEKREKAAS